VTLRYLLDENISPVACEQIARKNPEIYVESVYRWQGGIFVGQTDDRVLQAATVASLTLVTYDLKTIPPLLTELSSDNEAHAGIVFVEDATIRKDDFGRLVNALLAHWQRYHEDDWTNRIAVLTAG
jgi:hypothetical protein